MKRLFVALFVLAAALAGGAQAQTPLPAKIAISSLVGDTLTVSVSTPDDVVVAVFRGCDQVREALLA